MGRRVQLGLMALAGFALAVVPALGSDQSVKTTAGNTFDPNDVTVNVGEKVTISNAAGGNHDLQWDDRAMKEAVVAGTPWSSDRTFDKAGDYRFYCTIHGGPNGVGMSGIVHVVVAGGGGGTTTTQSQPPPTTGSTSTSPPPPGDTSTTPTTSTTTTPDATTTAPSQNAAAADTRAPRLRARAGSLRRRIQLAFTVTERARIVAVIRGHGARTTVRFVLVPGNRIRTLVRHARPGRYTITLTATDEAGNRTRAVRKTVHVRP